MKIITWNVNGIRAALGKNALDWAFEQQPDALCLQEVKAREEQLSEEQRGASADQIGDPIAVQKVAPIRGGIDTADEPFLVANNNTGTGGVREHDEKRQL